MSTLVLPGEELFRLHAPYAREKGLVPWRPRAGGISRRVLDDVLAQIEQYRDHLPIGDRTLTYRLLPAWVGPELQYPNKDGLYGMVKAITVKARRAGLIPFTSIDDARTSWDGPLTTQALPGIVSRLQINRQAGQQYHCEVWCETRGNVARLANIRTPYGISVYSGSGSVPISANLATARRIIAAQREHQQPTLLLVLGDLDVAGLKNIAAALHDDVLAFVRNLGGDVSQVFIRHLGVTAAMAADLPEAAREYFPDPPADWPLVEVVNGRRMGVKVELEALPPDELDALVRSALAVVRDEEAYTAAMAGEPLGRISALQELAFALRTNGAPSDPNDPW
jgi:hypothetical protein